jgi:hypothetical protein
MKQVIALLSWPPAVILAIGPDVRPMLLEARQSAKFSRERKF